MGKNSNVQNPLGRVHKKTAGGTHKNKCTSYYEVQSKITKWEKLLVKRIDGENRFVQEKSVRMNVRVVLGKYRMDPFLFSVS